MKKILVAAAFVVGSSTAVFAADMIEQQAAASAFTWAGPYFGIDGGAGWLNGDFSAGGGSLSEDFNGGILGGFVGYNWQLDNSIVLGVEGNVEYNWNDKDFLGANIGTDWSGAVRARVGYAFDNALLYGAAGWTATRGFVDAAGFDKETKTFNGYTVGAGLDYAFTNNVFGRVEYRYNDYGSKDILGFDVDLDQHVVKVGLGIKF